IDLAMHAARTRRLGLPQDAREAFTLLERAGAISPGVAKRMRAMVGFRNVAVHQYQDLSLPILRAILDERLDDFTAFTHALNS
ncbi:MAG TPA: HepT-like ribonuclease domain-containing protein, partial [Gammaproteobacteria bacterium]|nr:HepT-like ribonuclease domain-containing protein [Gammaproteobacteria bacterium]